MQAQSRLSHLRLTASLWLLAGMRDSERRGIQVFRQEVQIRLRQTNRRPSSDDDFSKSYGLLGTVCWQIQLHAVIEVSFHTEASVFLSTCIRNLSLRFAVLAVERQRHSEVVRLARGDQCAQVDANCSRLSHQARSVDRRCRCDQVTS